MIIFHRKQAISAKYLLALFFFGNIKKPSATIFSITDGFYEISSKFKTPPKDFFITTNFQFFSFEKFIVIILFRLVFSWIHSYFIIILFKYFSASYLDIKSNIN